MHLPKIVNRVIIGQGVATFVTLTILMAAQAERQVPSLNKLLPYSKQPKFDSRVITTTTATTTSSSSTSSATPVTPVTSASTSNGAKLEDTRVSDLLDPKTIMNATWVQGDALDDVNGNRHPHLQQSPIELNDEKASEKLSIISDERMVTWILGLVFVTIINLSSILGVLLVPFWTPNVQINNSSKDKGKSTAKSVKMSTQESFACSKLHNTLEGLAFGSLLASSIFHLVPHAFDLVGQDGEHEYLYKSLLVFAGIYLFYWLERILILLTDSLKHLNFSFGKNINFNSFTTDKIDDKGSTTKFNEHFDTEVHLTNSHSLSNSLHSSGKIIDSLNNLPSSGTLKCNSTANSFNNLLSTCNDFNLIHNKFNFSKCQKFICKNCNSIYTFQFTNQHLFTSKSKFICPCSQENQNLFNTNCNLDYEQIDNSTHEKEKTFFVSKSNSILNSSKITSSTSPSSSPVIQLGNKVNSNESLNLLTDEKFTKCLSQSIGLTELTTGNTSKNEEESIDGHTWSGKLGDNLSNLNSRHASVTGNKLDDQNGGLKSIAIVKSDKIDDDQWISSSSNNKSESIFNEIQDDSKFNLILMVILGDAVHNFIDGLSLGAGLIDSHLTGCSIATAILFEEIPHELGDFWILLSSGMSIKSAIKLNLLSSISCYAGLIGGLIIGENWGGNSSIFAITAGMFIYIALFNVLSDLKNNLDIVKSVTNNSITSMIQTLIWQNIGIITGVALLYKLAIIDEKLLFQSLRINL